MAPKEEKNLEFTSRVIFSWILLLGKTKTAKEQKKIGTSTQYLWSRMFFFFAACHNLLISSYNQYTVLFYNEQRKKNTLMHSHMQKENA